MTDIKIKPLFTSCAHYEYSDDTIELDFSENGTVITNKYLLFISRSTDMVIGGTFEEVLLNTLEHEIIHSVLHKFISFESSLDLDNPVQGMSFEFSRLLEIKGETIKGGMKK